MTDNYGKIGKMKVFLRPMTAEDIPQALGIEKEAFPTMKHSTPFRRDLNSSLASYLLVCVSRVPGIPQQRPHRNDYVSSDGYGFIPRLMRNIRKLFRALPSTEIQGVVVLGYVGLWFTGSEAHITSIAVRESVRGMGFGDLLMIGSLELALERNCTVLTLEVRVSNDIAKALYKKFGLIEVGKRRGYYVDNREDALIMSTQPLNSAGLIERLDQLVKGYIRRRGEVSITVSASAD